MKKLSILITLLTFSILTAPLVSAQEIGEFLKSRIKLKPSPSSTQEIGEFCWQSINDSCLLRLQITQHNNYFALNGKQTCPDDSSTFSFIEFNNVTSQVNGSGYISGDKMEIGLNLISSGYYPDATEKSFAATQLQGEINLSDSTLTGVNISDVPPTPVPINYTKHDCKF